MHKFNYTACFFVGGFMHPSLNLAMAEDGLELDNWLAVFEESGRFKEYIEGKGKGGIIATFDICGGVINLMTDNGFFRVLNSEKKITKIKLNFYKGRKNIRADTLDIACGSKERAAGTIRNVAADSEYLYINGFKVYEVKITSFCKSK